MGIDLTDPFKRLVASGLRLNQLRSEPALHEALIDEAAELSGAERVLLVLRSAEKRHIAAAQLPAGEDAAPLLQAVTPWLDEAAQTQEPKLRHGPEGAAEEDQRSCLVAPLVAQGELLGWLYADIEGAFGRFRDDDRDLLAMLAGQAAVALANLRFAGGLEAQVADRTAEARSAQAEAEQRAGELALINGIQQAMADSLDFQAIVDLVGDKLREVLHTDTLGIRWYDDEARRVSFLYEVERGQRIHPAPRQIVPGGPVEQLSRTRQPLLYPTREAMRAAGLLRVGAEQCLSAMRVPIVRGERMVAFISLENYEREQAYGEAELGLVATIAASMGVALDNARLFKETQEALQRQTATAEILKVIASSPADVQPVFDAIVVAAPPLVSGFSCVVALREGGLMRLVARTPLGASDDDDSWKERTTPIDGNRLYERAVRDRAPTQIVDIQRDTKTTPEFRAYAKARGFRSAVAIPLLADGEVIGAFSVSCVEPRRFSDRELDLLSTFADQAVIAIRNTRLFNETQEALAHQTASADILRVISSSPTDVQPVFEAIVGTAVKHLGCDLALVQTVSGDTYSPQAMATPAGLTPVPGAQLMPVDPAANFPSRAIRSKAMLHVPDWTAVDLPAHEQVRHQQLGLNSALYLPLLRGDDCVGVLVLGCKKAHAFNPKAIALAESFRDQALIAVENVRLFNETREALERQTASAEVLQVISSSVADTRPVFDKILDSCRRVIACTDLALLMLDGDGMVHIGAVRGAGGLKSAENYVPMPLQRTIVGEAVQQRRVMHYPDALHGVDVPRPVRRMADVIGNYAVVVAPMLVQDRAVGAFFIVRTFGDRQWARFTEREIALVESFAGQAAIAIQNARLFNETQEALERQTATAEVLAVISESPTDVQPVFQAIAERARALCKADVGATTRLDGDVVHLAGVRAQSTQAEEGMRSAFPMALEAAPPNIRRAIVEQHPVQIADVHAEPGYPSVEVAQRSGFRGILSVPLLHQGRAIGTIGVARREPGRFADSAVALLQTFARQAVIAIENVRLFRETQESLEHQTATSEVLNVIAASVDDAQPVFDKIIDSAAQLFPDALALMILQTDAQDMLHVAGIRFVGDASGPFPPEAARQRERAIAQAFPSPLAGTATELAIRTGLADIPDMQNATEVPGLQRFAKIIGFNFAALFAPLMWEGKGIGSIAMLSARLGPFGERERALIKTFADQAVIAIQNARLFNETQEALQRQTATSEILQVISGSPTDVQPVLQAVAERAAKICDAQFVDIILRQGETIRGVAVFGDLGGPTGEPVPLDRSTVMGRAIVDRHPVHVHDLQQAQNEYPRGSELARQHGHHTTLAVPLLREGRALGSILVRRTEVQPFDDKHIALLRTFADQAAIAMENVRLFNETKEALERQTATAEVLEAIGSSVADTQPVFDKIVDSCRKLFATTDVAILIVDGQDQVHVGAAQGPAAEPLRRTFPRPLAGGGVEHAIVQRRVLHHRDVLADADVHPGLRTVAGMLGIGTYSQAMAPMLWEGRGIGVITVTRQPATGFTEQETGLLKTFADQAVIAIQNARLFRETNESLERQTATAEILKVIASSPSDVQPVFDAIARSSNQLLGGWSTMVARIEDDALHLVAFTSTTPEGDAALRRSFPIALDAFPMGAAIRRGEIVAHRRHRRGRRGPAAGARAGPRARLPQHAVLPAGARRAEHRHDQRHAARTRALRAAPGGAAADLCRPGGDRDRERAPVQRDAGIAAAAEGLGRGAGRHQQLDGRCAAGVREDPGQLQAPVRRRRARRAAGRRAGHARHRRLPWCGAGHRRRHLPGTGGTHARRPRAARAARDALARPDRRRRRARRAAQDGQADRLHARWSSRRCCGTSAASAPSAWRAPPAPSSRRSWRCCRPSPTRR